MDLQHFKNIHAGQTALLVGNGLNLHHTPPSRFPYPSIGMNTIHKYIDWMPTYYIAVDHRVYREFGEAIASKYKHIPKFIPTDLKDWQGDNFVRWHHRPGEMSLNGIDEGMTYRNVMHAALTLGYYMGFTTMLIVGMHHKPGTPKMHFWGEDTEMKNPAPLAEWLEGYGYLVREMAARGVRVLNISVDTYVPDEVIPRDDWRKYDKESEISARLSRSRDKGSLLQTG